MEIKTLFLCGAMAMAIVGTTGCDSKDDEPAASRPTGTQPTPGNSPVSSPEPLPTDSLPFEAGKLNVVAAFPGPGEPRVALVSPISVQFDADVMQESALASAIAVSSAAGAIEGSISLEQQDTLVFRPANLWQPETVYTVAVDSALMSVDGLEMTGDTTWQFKTIADVYTTPQDVIDGCMSDLDVEMLAAVNRARIETRDCGENTRPAVGKLVWNCLLQQAAITHSEDMANNNFFDHTGSDGSKSGDRITRTGYVWSHSGENLAAGQRTVATVMNDLLDSPGHCDNIMYPHYTEFGFGLRTNDAAFYTRYWTQNFARPFRF